MNQRIIDEYEEIRLLQKGKEKKILELKEMFLLSDETLNELKFKYDDTDDKILEKVYQADAKIIAKKDAEIKKQFEELTKLNTKSENYQEDIESEVNKLVKLIPIQNRTALTQYVARRKIILDLFDKILEKKLKIQNNTNNKYDESLIHNLLFQQGADNPETSDLWIINEDFIYFKGVSEKQLSKLKIEDRELFKKIFSKEEEKYLLSLGENRKIKRPDVLLFPEEGKCIIIEFKDPSVNASEHLTQIDFYANLIRNYTVDEIQITTFYGYLIGENIEPRDVLGRVSRYEHSYQFDYLYRPSENVIGFDGRSNGSIYNEVIKYSTLLKRAKLRNKIFIDKLKL